MYVAISVLTHTNSCETKFCDSFLHTAHYATEGSQQEMSRYHQVGNDPFPTENRHTVCWLAVDGHPQLGINSSAAFASESFVPNIAIPSSQQQR